MTRKMLINAMQAEETRLAVVEDRHLQYLDLASSKRQQKKGNIYKATISRIEQSLNAVFVSYGSGRHGFLPIKEIAPEYFTKPKNMKEPLSLRDVLKEGQELMIQIQKEERGNKGAAVTTYITLPGTYVVLMPNNDKAGGVSRSLDGPDRSAMKSALNQLKIPGDYGVIIRTAGLGRTQEELQLDLDLLVNLWHTILDIAKIEKAPKLIYQETNLLLRAVRDYLREDIAEIIIDNNDAYNELLGHVKRFRPDYIKRLKLYEGEIPLFSRYQIEGQIELAYQREIGLPSGGAIVIDHTEALTSVDVNSAKATKGGDIEETALKTNLEAAKEVARQLRIRDLGGLVVIDFIDMLSSANKRKVERIMQQSIKSDKARVQIGVISKFGLLEMSRQRIRPSLQETSHHVCPRCNGKGAIRSVESLGLSVIRHIRDTAILADTEEVQVQLPVELASFLLNEKRNSVVQIEDSTTVKIVLVPNPYLETPEYQITRIKSNDEQESISSKSYMLVDKPDVALIPERKAPEEVPSIKSLPEIDRSRVKKPLGLFRKLYESLFVSETVSLKPKPKAVGDRNRNSPDRRRKSHHHQQKHKTTEQRSHQSHSQSQKPDKGRSPQKGGERDQRQKASASPTKPDKKTVNRPQAVKKPASQTTAGSKEIAKAAKPSQKRPAEQLANKQKTINKGTESIKTTQGSPAKQEQKTQAPNETLKVQPSSVIDKDQTKPVEPKSQAKPSVSKESKKTSSGNRVDEVLKRVSDASKADSKQIETAVVKKANNVSSFANTEEVVQATKPKTKKSAQRSEKIIAIETKSRGAQDVQKDNLSLDVALVGEKKTSVAKSVQDKAAKPKKKAANSNKAKASKKAAPVAKKSTLSDGENTKVSAVVKDEDK